MFYSTFYFKKCVALPMEDEQKNQVATESRTPGSAKREEYASEKHIVVVIEGERSKDHVSTPSVSPG